MKLKDLALLSLLVATVMLTANSMAEIVYPRERAERDFDTTATEKLDRGIQNIVLFPFEITEGWYQNSGRMGVDDRGLFKGTADGFRNAGVRLAQGLWDTVTFPLNTGNFEVPWDPPPDVLHPEWVPVANWIIPSHFDEYVDKSYGDWYSDKYENWQAAPP